MHYVQNLLNGWPLASQLTRTASECFDQKAQMQRMYFYRFYFASTKLILFSIQISLPMQTEPVGTKLLFVAVLRDPDGREKCLQTSTNGLVSSVGGHLVASAGD